MSFSDTDKGYKRTLAALFGKKPTVKVGIFGPLSEQAEKNDDGSDGPLTVAQVAEFHEFGLGNNPERSFIRAYCDEHEKDVVARLRKDSELAVKGKIRWDQVLERLGLFVQGGIQQKIADGIPPELTDARVKQKTRNGKEGGTPLINWGTLRASVTYQVDDGSE